MLKLFKKALRALCGPAWTRASFADQIAKILVAPGMSARIIDGSKDCQSSYALVAGSRYKHGARPQQFECHFGPDAPELQGVEGFMEIFPHDHMLDFEAFEQSSGGDSHALDGYALYDLGTRKLLGIIEECRLRVEYEYTAESRIVLLDPDGDSVDYTFSKP